MNDDLTFDAEQIKLKCQEMASNLLQNTGEQDFAGFSAKTIYKRLSVQPNKYREYGVYWYPLKKALDNLGYKLGNYYDAYMISRYSQSSDIETIVTAELFRDYYGAHFFSGTNSFNIGQEDVYTLFDEELELVI